MIAETLVRSDPASDAHADRLRRALAMLDVSDPERAIARLRAGAVRLAEDALLPMEDPDFSGTLPGVDQAAVLSEVDVFVYPEHEVPDAPDPGLSRESPDGALGSDSSGDRAATLEISEIDLSGALSGLTSSVEDADPQTDEEMRARGAREQQASAALGQYEQALQYLEQGLVKEAITELEGAAKVPMLRFRAAAQLGRIYIDGGDISSGIEWLERAVEAPAPTPDEGYAVLYALAAALEIHGESARALAILMELDADADGYRDVRDRIAHLTRAQTGSHRG